MKRSSLLLSFIAICFIVSFTSNSFAVIRYLDANTANTLPGVFHDFAAAQTGSNNDDTIYVAAGAYNIVGSLNFTKRLYWIGNGYRAAVNDPNASVIYLGSGITSGSINFVAGSSGSVFESMYVYVVSNTNGAVSVNADNITLQRDLFSCYFPNQLPVAVTGNNCIVQSIEFILGSFTAAAAAQNLTLRNNELFAGDINLQNGTGIFSVYNNVFDYTLTNPSSISPATESFNRTLDFFNNILINVNAPTNSSNIYNNISNVTNGLPVGNGNQSGVASSTIFQTGSFYQIPNSSPAHNAGFGGIDCGMWAGPTPFIINGLPPVPTIDAVTGPGSGTPTSTITINVQASAHP